MNNVILNIIVIVARVLCMVPLVFFLGYLWRHRNINGVLRLARRVLGLWCLAGIALIVLTIVMRVQDVIDRHMVGTCVDEVASIATSVLVLVAGWYSIKFYKKLYKIEMGKTN